MMRGRAVPMLAAVLLLPGLAQAQQPKVLTKSAPTPLEAAAIAQEQLVLQALVRGDAAAMNDALGNPGILMVGSDGISTWTTETAAAFLKSCTTTSETPSDFRSIAATKDVVVVAYRSVGTQVCQGRKSPDFTNALSVWQRKGGRWSVVAHSETPPAAAPPARFEGVWEYLPPLKGQTVFQGGRYSSILGTADGSMGLMANVGTYRVLGDTVECTIGYTTDSFNSPGTSYRWISRMVSPDTLAFTLLTPSGGVAFTGRNVRVR